MLVICNGGMKSGSTWLMNMVRVSGLFTAIDNSYTNPLWKNPSIAPEKLDLFFKEKKYRSSNLFCKQHWSGKKKYRDLLKEEHAEQLE